MLEKKQRYFMYLPIRTARVGPSFTLYTDPTLLLPKIWVLGKFYLGWYFLWRLTSARRPVRALRSHLSGDGGINHTRSSLHALMAEAYYLRRTPILLPIIPPKVHNLGGPVEEMCISDYFDLSKSSLKLEKKEIALEYALPETVLKDRDKIRSMKLFNRYETIPEDANQHYDLIVREKNKRIRLLPGSYKDPEVAKIYYRSSLYLPPKKYLLEVAEKVIEKLGNFFFLFCRMPWDQHTINFKENIHNHVARYSPDNYSIFKYFMTGEDLSRQLLKIFPKGSKLYIASNLWPPHDKDLFGPLQKYYDVYRYYDFPELAYFADLTKKIGNNTIKLQLIEETLQQASIEVFGVHYFGKWRADDSLDKLVSMSDSPDWIEDSIQ